MKISNPLLSPFVLNDKLLMLALDHRGSFEKIMEGDSPYLIDTKRQIMESLEPLYSGVLVDLKYGLPALQKMTSQKPYLLCIEKTGYEVTEGERSTILESSVEELVKKGAKGIKILLFFNPHAKNASSQAKIAQAVLADCKKFHTPFFLEIVTYPIVDTQSENLVVTSVEYFLNLGIIPDVFKLEYPGDSSSCQIISQKLGNIPWILLTQGQNYETFKSNLQVAAKNGASGFLAGRSIWQEIGSHKENLSEFLEKTVVPRFAEISQIMLES